MAEAIRPEYAARLRRQLLERRMAAAGLTSATPSIPVAAGDQLSFGQRRIWFLDRLAPGLAVYNIPAAVRVDGPLDVAILSRAFTEVVRRHEVLRTVFSNVDGEPRQRATEVAQFELPLHDLDGTSPDTREAEARRRATAFAAEPFDLASGPLLRAALFKLAVDDHLLVIVAHHIASDGASAELLIHEVTSISLDLAAGRAPTLPELPCQYSSYAAWQHGQFTSGALQPQLDFWRQQLHGMPGVLGLPTDRPRGPLRHVGAKLDYVLESIPDGAAAALAARHDTTVFVVLLAGFKALLARYTGGTDIVVGTPINHRPLPEFERLIGFFVNTLALRSRLDGDPSFATAIARTRTTLLDAMANRDVPFELLVQELNPARLLSQSPLVQVMFSYQPAAPAGKATGAIRFEPVTLHLPLAKFDLSVYVTERDQHLVAVAEYDTGLFNAATIARLMRHFDRFLHAALVDPARPLSTLDPLDADERPVVRCASSSRPAASTIHAAFLAVARSMPDAPAAIEGERELTYAELAQASAGLATSLSQSGIGTGDVVAVILPPSTQLLIAVLGVLRAGAAYLPIDPRQPPPRIASMLDAASVTRCVTDAATAARLPTSVDVVRVDDVDGRLGANAPNADVDGDLAYVIFTSGSTGHPKGVMVEHRAVVNLLRSIADVTGMTAGDRLLALTTPGFDIAALEWFLPLLTGGTVVIPTPGTARDGAAIAERLTADRITMLQGTPATWRLLVDAGWQGAPGLKALCGGESLPLDLARELTPRVGALWNVYGPTETTIWSMIWRVPAAVQRIVLGEPVPGTTVAVLAPDGAAVPPGGEGELYIGGSGLARGYLGAAALTAARFIPVLVDAEPGARWYRTGDRVRWHADRSIEFLGRSDHQVKLRGFRIEPGEIEATLLRHHSVEQAVVVTTPENAGDARLVALVRTTDQTTAAEGLRQWLRGQLPDYMIPAELRLVEAFPLSASGKVDRRALAALVGGVEATAPGVGPATEHEELLAAIYAEALERPAVDVTTGFFDLGGHSLLAARVVARARAVFGLDIPLRTIFESPSVRDLAGRLSTLRGEVDHAPIPSRAPGQPAPELLSFAQQRLYFIDRLDEHAGANLVFAARIHSRLEAARLARCLGELVRRHETLRTAFVEVDGSPRAHLEAAGTIPLTVTDTSTLDEPGRRRHVESVARQLAVQRFDLGRAPLAAAELIHESAHASVLVLALHHLIADGPSIAILTRELAALYGSADTGGSTSLAPLTVHYADFAQWQRDQLTPEVVEQRLDFWRRYVQGAALTLEFVFDYRRDTRHAVGADAVRPTIAPATVHAIEAFARRHHATLFMVLLASWQAYLARWTSTEDFLVGSPVANRPRPELDDVVGMFADTIVLRADLRGDPTFADLVARVRRSQLDALAHQDLPFELLVEALAPPRQLDRSPLFQTMFTLQHEREHGVGADETAWQPVRLAAGVSRFDVSLALTYSPGALAPSLEFRTELFTRDSIEAASEQWLDLLTAALAAPDVPLSRLAHPAPTPAPAVPYGVEPSGWLGGQSTDTAIVSEAGTTTYRQLAERIDQLTTILDNEGIGAQALVPIAADRDPDTIALMLAVWRRGAGYVPVPSDAPDSRRRQILTQVGQQRVWHAATMDATSSGQPADVAPHPEAPAYVIFTSGSSGTPKGLVVPRRAVAHYVRAARTRYALTAADRVLQFASLAFDASVEEIFPTLAAGAVLVLPPAEVYASIEGLIAVCRRQSVSVLALPTAYWHQLVTALSDGRVEIPGEVRLVIIGGEAPRVDCVADWPRLAPRATLMNTYGPTEATVVSTTWTLVPPATADVGGVLARVPLGDAMPGAHVRVTGRHLDGAPVGVPGELLIGGHGVALGYIGDPRQTAERFVPDPFSATPGARAFRTGDRARTSTADSLEFLGRLDRQVKIRGFRVEPGEVEAVLCTHPAVAHCAVAAGPDRQGDTRLVAAVVSADGAHVVNADLRAYLSERLPSYLVPTEIVPVDRIPVTSSGKLDLAAVLARVEAEAPADETGDPLVDLLASIWSRVLGVRAGAHQSFFDLGGHSLLMLELVAELRASVAVDVPLRAIFDSPSPAELAVWLRTSRPGAAALPPVVPRGLTIAPLSVAQARIFEVQRRLPDAGLYHVNAAVRLDADLDPQVLVDALNDVAARHPVLAARVVASEPPMLAASALPLEIDYFDLSALDPDAALETAGELAYRLRQLPFDLEHEAPLRLWLVRVAPAGSVVLITLHHLVGDGVSVEILLAELAEHCRARLASTLPQLSLLRVSFFDVMAWERETLDNGGFAPQRSFWRERLRGAAAPLLLPGGRTGSQARHFDVARDHRFLSRDVVGPVFELASRHRGTPFMAALTLLNVALARLTGGRDVRLASMTANRVQPDTAALIGLLANTLVLRLRLDDDAGFDQLLADVRRMVLEAIDHQEVPFETVLCDLEADNTFDRTNLAPILVLWQYHHAGNATEPAWAARPLFSRGHAPHAEHVATGFDLVWEWHAEPDGLRISLLYRTDRYDADAVRPLLDEFERLAAVVARGTTESWRHW